MRRWLLLGILVIAASWEGWTLFQGHRASQKSKAEAPWLVAYQHATQSFYMEDCATAEKGFTDLLPMAEKRYPKDRNLAGLLSMLGTCYRADHKYEQAEPVLKRALEVYKQISPADPLGSERTEANLGGVYLDREDYAAAEQHFFRGTFIFRENAEWACIRAWQRPSESRFHPPGAETLPGS